MRWLLHCNTGCLNKYKPSVPCSILLSNNFVIVKAYSKNIMDSTDLAYSEKVNLKVLVWLSFQGLPLFLDTEKSTKCRYFASVDTGHKLNVHKTFRRCPGHLLNILCTFDLHPVFIGVTGCSFIHPSLPPPATHLIFATESLIISLQHIVNLCISLLSQCLWTVGIT